MRAIVRAKHVVHTLYMNEHWITLGDYVSCEIKLVDMLSMIRV